MHIHCIKQPTVQGGFTNVDHAHNLTDKTGQKIKDDRISSRISKNAT